MRWTTSITCAALLGLLGPLAANGAKPARKHQSSPLSMAADSSMIEVQPNIGPSVMRDPEILGKAELISLVKKYANDIASALLDGESQREIAVQTRDVIKLSCIQDRLSNMKMMKILSDQRFAATTRDDIRADELNLRHEFRGVELAHERVIELHRELLQCVGESLDVTTPGEAGGPASSTATPDPASTNVEVPRVDRPPPASAYR